MPVLSCCSTLPECAAAPRGWRRQFSSAALARPVHTPESARQCFVPDVTRRVERLAYLSVIFPVAADLAEMPELDTGSLEPRGQPTSDLVHFPLRAIGTAAWHDCPFREACNRVALLEKACALHLRAQSDVEIA